MSGTLSSTVSGQALKNLFSLTEPLGEPSPEAPLSAVGRRPVGQERIPVGRRVTNVEVDNPVERLRHQAPQGSGRAILNAAGRGRLTRPGV